jgi:hypothetical protein
MYDPILRRRFGYLVPAAPAKPLVAMLERAGARPRALNRVAPPQGHLVGDCPLCGSADTLWVARDRESWSTTCCTSGSLSTWELHAALVTRTGP